jgi:hypothetical protein
MKKMIAMVTVLVFAVSAMVFAGVTKTAPKAAAAAAVTTTAQNAKPAVSKAVKAKHHKAKKAAVKPADKAPTANN